MSITLLKLPHEEIIFENYADEMVLLDLPRAVYYTLDRTGADCLLTLLSAPSAKAAQTELLRQFASPADEILSGVQQLVAALTGYGLAVLRRDEEPGITIATESANSGRAFSSPRLDRYEDIEDILKFDPVHEVSEGGWPNVRNDASDKA